MRNAHVSTAEVNGGNPTLAEQQPSREVSGAASMALSFLQDIQNVEEQVHGLAVSARMYLQNQDTEPDFFVLNFFNVIVSLLESNELFQHARQYLKPLAGEAAQ